MGKWEEKRVYTTDDGTEFRRVDAGELETNQYLANDKSYWQIEDHIVSASDDAIVSEEAMMELADTLRSTREKLPQGGADSRVGDGWHSRIQHDDADRRVRGQAVEA